MALGTLALGEPAAAKAARAHAGCLAAVQALAGSANARLAQAARDVLSVLRS